MANIRPAKPEDAAGIARVHVDSWRSTYRGIIPNDFLDNLSVDRRTSQWQRTLDHLSPSEPVFVCEQAGLILGFISCGPPQTEMPGFDSEVLAIYLLASEQGKGLGRQLFELGTQALQAHGAQACMLWVLADNPSRGFYEHLGGKEISRRTIEIAGQPLGEIAYGWEF